MRIKKQKEYIGDSVYVDQDLGGRFILTTENGFGPSNTIVLEPEVFEALLIWASKDNHIIEVKNES